MSLLLSNDELSSCDRSPALSNSSGEESQTDRHHLRALGQGSTKRRWREIEA